MLLQMTGRIQNPDRHPETNKEENQMSKTITVWGNPGCGKSMFCCNLAKVLTANKEKALIINADSSTPMLPVKVRWLS